MERYLTRISLSEYSENLIFKGGMCLDKYLDLGSYTKDIDFLLKSIESRQESITSIMNEISSIDAKDGFIFKCAKVENLDAKHKKYPGYRIKISGYLGGIKNAVLIDIGVGDVVRPRVLEIELMSSNGPIFEKTINLNAYPPEYIFSEKVEAIVRLGELNSRMKDFFDCHQILEKLNFQSASLCSALRETFANRQQTLRVIGIPAGVFESNWKAFLGKNSIENLELESIINSINKIIFDAIGRN